MPAALCIALNGLLPGFVFMFFLRHGNGGEETAQIDLKTIQMPKKNHSHVIIDKSYLLRPIGHCTFGLFPNLILQNRAIRLCSMQYAKTRPFR